ncbi:hypothetical protein GQ53DRAFT_439886 [Thozetella sp. PMI_491]|nr:hypothetical protein GQ53DRAFT_439886 [Thozetella sp. PMI_491]
MISGRQVCTRRDVVCSVLGTCPSVVVQSIRTNTPSQQGLGAPYAAFLSGWGAVGAPDNPQGIETIWKAYDRPPPIRPVHASAPMRPSRGTMRYNATGARGGAAGPNSQGRPLPELACLPTWTAETMALSVCLRSPLPSVTRAAWYRLSSGTAIAHTCFVGNTETAGGGGPSQGLWVRPNT